MKPVPFLSREMSQLSLLLKLLLVPTFAMLSFSAYLVYSSLVLSGNNTNLKEIRDSQFPALDAARENVYALKAIITELDTAAASGETSPLDVAQSIAGEVRGRYVKLQEIDPVHKQEFLQLASEFDVYFSRSLAISRNMATRANLPDVQALQEMRAARDAYLQHAAAYRDTAEQRFLGTVEDATVHVERARILGPVIGGIMLLVLALLTFLVTRGILALEKEVQERADRLLAKKQELETALERANTAERRIITISEETQRKIGQELHDDLGQQLTGIAFMSELLAKRMRDEGHPAAAEASSITGHINEAISKTRKLAQGLYPVALGESGLTAMLENLVQSISSLYPVECELVGDGECEITEPLASINLFRIAQEAVNNAIKHSGAGNITLRLARKDGAIALEIADDGCGIPLNSAAGDGLGMHSMRYRASLLGADFYVENPAGGGAVVRVILSAVR